MTTYILIAHLFFKRRASVSVAAAQYDTREQCMAVAYDVARSAPALALAQRAIFITWECVPVVAP